MQDQRPHLLIKARYRMKRLLIALLILLSQPLAAADSPTVMDPGLRERAGRAIDAGLRYLRAEQAADGSWSDSVGLTALALRGYLESHRGYDEGDGPFISRPLAYMLSHVNADGSISETRENRAYNTAVAIVTLEATGNPAYEAVIADAQRYLTGLQLEETKGYPPTHKYHGGIGYGGDERPDLSNLYLALEALSRSGLDQEDPTWARALVFVSRSQNLQSSNDQEWAENDGGFTYMPGSSPHGGTGSYGGMTYAGLISLLFAGADREDPRVQAAYEWIRAHYTLERNPGAPDLQGLYYYYEAFAKAMRAFGGIDVVDTDGVAHNWRNDITAKLLSLQNDDGSWVNEVSPRWWEGNPHLCTARAVIILIQAIAP